MENKNLTLGSLFDGSGGFPLGGLISGITPIWSSEIEPFPIRVTTKRMPQVKHYGDISTLRGSKLEPVDIITFGSPCQDMSVAGKRDGLNGSRSSLFFEAIRIIKEMRCSTNGRYPRFIVWENVPGAFSSNKGEDFRAVLEEICKVKDTEVSVPKPSKWENAGHIMGDDYTVAWRQFDAQFWGVPQRRKRIYLVADFAGGSAGKILFESEGLSGYSSQSFKSWQGATNYSSESIGKTSTDDSLMFENHGQDSRYTGPLSISQTVLSTFGTGGNNQPFVVEGVRCFDVRFTSDGTRNARQNCYETDTSRTIDTGGNAPDSNQGGIAVVSLQGSMIGRADKNGPQGSGVSENISFTLNTVDKHAVVYAIDRESINCGKNFARNPGITDDGVNSTLNAQGPSAVAIPAYSSSKASFFTSAEEELANTLVATDYKDPPIVNYTPSYGFYPQMKSECINFTEEKSGCLVNGTNPRYQNGVLESDYIVRRLTPTECARLQGFPNWWCDDLGTKEPTDEDIAYWKEVFENYAKALGKKIKPKTDNQIRKWLINPHSDSAEYKMWGNGVALPNVVFVLSGIVYYSQFPT